MAADEPLPPEARNSPLSVEDAERFASQIRPSWEILDTETLASAALELAPEAGAPGSAPDTIIEGVPAVVITDAAGSNGAKADAGDDGIDVDLDGPKDAPAEFKPLVLTPAVKPADLPLPPTRGQPLKADAAGSKAARPGKTQIGMGDPAPGRNEKRAPVSTRPPAAQPAAAPVRARATPAPSSGARGDDDIQIPVNGGASGLGLKIGIAAVVLLGLAGGGWALLGGKEPDAPQTRPTATATAAQPAATATATQPAATAAQPAATTPEPPATATPEPPAATATATAKAAEKPAAAQPPAKPAAKEPATPAAKEPAKPAQPPSKPAAQKPDSGKKPGGGIIRETPF